jgi:hypothetical protein
LDIAYVAYVKLSPYFVLDDPSVLGKVTTHTAVQLHSGGLVATNI